MFVLGCIQIGSVNKSLICETDGHELGGILLILFRRLGFIISNRVLRTVDLCMPM